MQSATCQETTRPALSASPRPQLYFTGTRQRSAGKLREPRPGEGNKTHKFPPWPNPRPPLGDFRENVKLTFFVPDESLGSGTEKIAKTKNASAKSLRLLSSTTSYSARAREPIFSAQYFLEFSRESAQSRALSRPHRSRGRRSFAAIVFASSSSTS